MHLAVRVDGGAIIGLGHAIRMLALVQAARDAGHKTVVITTGLPEQVVQQFTDEGAQVVGITTEPGSTADAQLTASQARAADWLLLDGYHFTPAYITSLRRAECAFLLVVDDCGHTSASSGLDALLNPNLHATADLYQGMPRSCRMLLGTHFALLRREFARAKASAPVTAYAHHLLVSCGGSDPAGITAILATALASLPGSWKATVVIGAANPRGLRAAGEINDDRFTIVADVTDMAGLMATCDTAVIAAGGTVLELACVGVPMAVVATVANQEPVVHAMTAAGAAVDLGHLTHDYRTLTNALRPLLTDADLRQRLRQQAVMLVDGKGAARVIDTLAGMAVCLRSATREDAARLFSWANDAETRRQSFHSTIIPWDDHVGWLERKLADPHGTLLIAEDGNGVPFGTSRIVGDGDECEISLTVAPERRGNGTGIRLIAATCRWTWAHRSSRWIRARIRPDNVLSKRAFARAGFSEVAPSIAPDGSACVSFILGRPHHD